MVYLRQVVLLGLTVAVLASPKAHPKLEHVPLPSYEQVQLLAENNLDPTTQALPSFLAVKYTPRQFNSTTAACAYFGETVANASAVNALLNGTKFSDVPANQTTSYYISGSSGSGSKALCNIISLNSTKVTQVECSRSLPVLCTNTAPAVTPYSAGDKNRTVIVNAPTNGLLRGYRDNYAFRFEGVRYAQPPVGKLRWKAPQPLALSSKANITSAINFGNFCVQALGSTVAGDEDCLFLNVYTNRLGSLNASDLAPVMFWVHGGGYVSGAGSSLQFDGANLVSRGDVVVVTINYRLGIMGFFEDIARSPRSVIPGNQGLRDQIAALQWVQRNIRAFGGDPTKVTIFGESAGATSIRSILASESTQGLYRGAIVGSDPSALPFQTPQLAAALTDFIVGSRNCSTISCTYQISAKELVAAQLTAAEYFTFNVPGVNPFETWKPTIDGILVKDDWHVAVAKGAFVKVPTIQSWLNYEAGALVEVLSPTPVSSNTTFAQFASIFIGAPLLQKMLAAGIYPPVNTSSDPLAYNKQLALVGTDAYFRCPTELLSQDMSKYTTVYQVELEQGLSHQHANTSICYQKACHGDDVNLVFANAASQNVTVWTPSDIRMTREYVDRWTSFAKSLNPNPKGYLPWKPREVQTSNILLVSATDTTAQNGSRLAQCQFYNRKIGYIWDYSFTNITFNGSNMIHAPTSYVSKHSKHA